MNCNDKDIPANLIKSQEIPNSYLVAPSSSDPASTLINILGRGANLNETMFSNRLAILYAGPMVNEFTNTTVCKVTFNDNSNYKLTGSTGLMATSTVELKYQTLQWYSKINLK